MCQLVVSKVTTSNVSILSYMVSFQGLFDRMTLKKWYMNLIFLFLPTVKVVQADDCLHMAIQSRVTEVSSWVTRPRTLHSEASHITVVPDVFS